MQHSALKNRMDMLHNNLQGRAKIKAAILLISSTFLVSLSAHAAEPITNTKTTINPTSINTNAINLAVMTENPTLLSETQRVTRAKTNTLTPKTNQNKANQTKANQAKTDQAIYSVDAIHHPVWAKNGMVASQEAHASDIGLKI